MKFIFSFFFLSVESSRLGVAAFASICVVGALAYTIYHIRQRRSRSSPTLPRFDFPVNEFRDEDPTTSNTQSSYVGRATRSVDRPGGVASFPSPTGISNPHSENWRRPMHYDKVNLVENMEQNKWGQHPQYKFFCVCVKLKICLFSTSLWHHKNFVSHSKYTTYFDF